MGEEHVITKKDCGCIHHYTYYEACDMGPIGGTEKRWVDLCDIHTKSKESNDAITLKYKILAKQERDKVAKEAEIEVYKNITDNAIRRKEELIIIQEIIIKNAREELVKLKNLSK